MKKPPKTLNKILIIAFILIIIISLFFESNDKVLADISIPKFDIESVKKIVLQSPKENSQPIILKKVKKSWILTGEAEFPANDKLVYQLLNDINNLKFFNEYQLNDDNRSIFKINKNNNCTVQFYKEKQKQPFITLKSGSFYRREQTPVSRYLLYGKKIYLSNKALPNLFAERRIWTKKFFPDIDNVQSFILKRGKEISWKIARKHNSVPFEFEYPVEYKSFSKEATYSIVSFLNTMQFMDIIPSYVPVKPFSSIIAKNTSLSISSLEQYTYQFLALGREKDFIRVKLVVKDLISGKTQLPNSELSFISKEWHFLVPRTKWLTMLKIQLQ